MRGGRNGPMSALTALSPGWASVVAGGGLALVVALGLLHTGVALALMIAGVFALFVGTVTLVGGRRAWAQSRHLSSLTYRDRRAVMASVMSGFDEVNGTLAPAVEEQALRVLRSQRASRRSLVLLSIACALQLAALIVEALAGATLHTSQVALVAAFVAMLAVVWSRESRRMSLAESAREAAKRAGA